LVGNSRLLVLVGTKKGGFVFESNSTRKEWKMRGPFFGGFSTYDMVGDDAGGRPTFYAAVNSWSWGPSISRSTDFGRTWKKAKAHPRFPEKNPQKLKVERIWNLQPDGAGGVYAGVEPAALFHTTDDAESWQGFDALNFHSTRSKWQPGAGGLCLHTIVLHPRQRRKLRVGISAVGVLGSDDGGQAWRFMNKGIRADFLPNKHPEWGQCVHKIDSHPSRPETLFLQNHGGVYVSPDFGASWREIGKALPSDFGFPVSVHRQLPETVYVVPVEAAARYPPKGEFQVWVSEDGGKQWRKSAKGLPTRAYFNVLREAMGLDHEVPQGIYVGTTSGHIFYSRDEAHSWRKLADGLPQINSVSCVAV
jgi:photosystem II stability/assembly factor-like uncharacterized protein